MLIVDLGRLAREGRLRLEREIGPDDPVWSGLDFRFAEPVHVGGEAQEVGRDVLFRGRLRGEVRRECRRCLEPAHQTVDEELSLFYKCGISDAEAEAEEVYALPERGDLDLGPALREQVALAVPRFAECREDCKGLCPTCGANLNEGDCGCEADEVDERWAALRRLNLE